MKIILWTIIILMAFTFILAGILKGEELYEPDYKLINSNDDIEIREYSDIILASTRIDRSYEEATSPGFRVLANYIFGNNNTREQIPMTAPVLTTMPGKEYINMSFVMSTDYTMQSLPKPNTDKIKFHTLKLGKAVVIKFGMWATPQRIKKMKHKLEEYINKNNLEVISDYYVAQYNSPWVMPPFRRNEVIVSIK
tara:strand:- start:2063 stop:2647 length:585 start_codon:yes stop_codon:yes gene_type:complete